MKFHPRLWSALLVAGDLCGILSGLYLALIVRVQLNPLLTEQLEFSPTSKLLLPLYLTTFLWILTFRELGLYTHHSRFDLARMLVQVIKGSSVVLLILVLASFISNSDTYSRSLIILQLPCSVLTIALYRLVIAVAARWLSRRGYSAERVAIVGWDRHSERIAAKLKSNPGVQFCGYIAPDAERAKESLAPQPCLGTLAEIGTVIELHQLSRVVYQNHARDHELLVRLAELCHSSGASLELVPDFFGFIPHQMRLTELGGIPLVHVRHIGMNRWASLLKRGVDITIASAALVILAPLCAAIALLIVWESRGGILYRQTRIGKDGRRFVLVKFRSMFEDAERRRGDVIQLNEREGVLFKIRRDPRVTRMGRFLRRYSLDELPQLLNVLRGDMSLVGPRPLPDYDLAKIDMERYGYWFQQRLRVLPGLAGLWQVSGRSELTFEEMVELDIYYIENWSLAIDFEILLRTVTEVVSGRGAY